MIESASAPATSPATPSEQLPGGVGLRILGRKAREGLTSLWMFVRSCDPGQVWRQVGRVWKVLTKLALTAAGVATFALIIILLVEVLTENTIAIAPLPVPEALEERGITPDVASHRLRDALRKFAEQANTRMRGPQLALHGDLPDFVVPTIGLTLQETAAYIRTFFHISRRRNISGELTIRDDLLRLRLRLNGREFYNSPKGVDPKEVDELFVAAASPVFEVTEPYFSAAALAREDPARAIQMAELIIADCPGNGVDCVESQRWHASWSHNLIGSIRQDKHRLALAIDEYEKAIKIDRDFAIAHSNWAAALRDQGKVKAAAAEYRKAIAADHHLAAAHKGLVSTLRAQRRTDEADTENDRAMIEYRSAVASDPRSVDARIDLAHALLADGKFAEAVDQFRVAVGLNRRNAGAHNGLGNALYRQGEALSETDTDRKAVLLQQAIEAFTEAIELESHYGEFHFNLGNALRRQDKPEEARVKYQRAVDEHRSVIKRDPMDATAHYKMAQVLHEMEKRDGAIAAYSEAIRIEKDFADAYGGRGYAYFEDGRFDAAATDLSLVVKRRPDDAYPVLWLYLADARSGKASAARDLAKNATNLKREWPYAVVELYLGRTKLEKVLEAAARNADYLCEAQFYIGEWYLLQRRQTDAKTVLTAAVKGCRKEFIEYWGAKAELDRPAAWPMP